MALLPWGSRGPNRRVLSRGDVLLVLALPTAVAMLEALTWLSDVNANGTPWSLGLLGYPVIALAYLLTFNRRGWIEARGSVMTIRIALFAVLGGAVLGIAIEYLRFSTPVTGVDPAVLDEMIDQIWLPMLIVSATRCALVLSTWMGFHYVLRSIAHRGVLEAERARMATLAERAKLQALTAQIAPHFLFNALNSIKALTTVDPAVARRLTVDLATLLRKTIQIDGEPSWELGAELEAVRALVAIEQVRLGDRLRARLEIDDALLERPVPRLLVLTLVENALKHGIAARTDGGTLTVRATLGESSAAWSLEVENDQPPTPSPDVGLGLGLRNLVERIELGAPGSEMKVGERAGKFRVQIRMARASPA